jgi:hypothetical protein
VHAIGRDEVGCLCLELVRQSLLDQFAAITHARRFRALWGRRSPSTRLSAAAPRRPCAGQTN